MKADVLTSSKKASTTLMPRMFAIPLPATFPAPLTPGPWVELLVGAPFLPHLIEGMTRTIAAGKSASLVTVRLAQARWMGALQFEQAIVAAYQAIRSSLATLRHCHPVRFWNYIPAIHEPMDARRDRYMVFNAGRFTAFRDWFDGPDPTTEHLPAASGVGHDGDDLVIHCLAFEQPGEAIENPRQIPAFQYSARYGPRPPCFARATLAPDPNGDGLLLLAAGTASIRGEQTLHATDLQSQLDETITNLRALLTTAERSAEPGNLHAFTDLCVYHLCAEDAPLIEEKIRAIFGPAMRLQMHRADICRADLLVEIEGVARLHRRSDQ